jgi:hypothetical protein
MTDGERLDDLLGLVVDAVKAIRARDLHFNHQTLEQVVVLEGVAKRYVADRCEEPFR